MLAVPEKELGARFKTFLRYSLYVPIVVTPMRKRCFFKLITLGDEAVKRTEKKQFKKNIGFYSLRLRGKTKFGEVKFSNANNALQRVHAYVYKTTKKQYNVVIYINKNNFQN